MGKLTFISFHEELKKTRNWKEIFQSDPMFYPGISPQLIENIYQHITSLFVFFH